MLVQPMSGRFAPGLAPRSSELDHKLSFWMGPVKHCFVGLRGALVTPRSPREREGGAVSWGSESH